MTENLFVLKHLPFAMQDDPRGFLRSISETLGVDINEASFSLPLAFHLSGVSLLFRERLALIISGCRIYGCDFGKSLTFSRLPQIGDHGRAHDLWLKYVTGMNRAYGMLAKMFPDVDARRILPPSVHCGFRFVASLGAIRLFLGKQDWLAHPDMYSEEWENLVFARKMLGVLKSLNQDFVSGMELLDPESVELEFPKSNSIRVSKETSDRRVSFVIQTRTLFEFHILAEKPELDGPELIASHDMEASGIEIFKSNNAFFMTIYSNSRMDIFSGQPKSHGLRVYGEWEYHGLTRAVRAYLNQPEKSVMKKKKHNVTLIFERMEDLEEFCFMLSTG